MDIGSARTKPDYFIVRSVIAGGIAGGVAKTAVAPLDRVKILFQTHHHEFARYSGSFRGAVGALAHILRTQGVFGLYRGHSLTLARAVPHAAIGYTLYESVRPLLMPTKADETSFRRMLAGSIAGVSVLPFTYPFELVRVRLAIETQKTKALPRLSVAVRAIYNEAPVGVVRSGIANFYRGFTVSILGTVPYRGGIFLVWETMNDQARNRLSAAFLARNRHKVNLTIGAIAGSSAQIVTYPLEVIRRIQQASGGLHPRALFGFRETARSIWRTQGWRGFYAGLGIGLVKQVPMHSISLSVWTAAKRFLNV